MIRKTRKQRGEQAHWCELRSLCFLNAAPASNLADVRESHAVVTFGRQHRGVQLPCLLKPLDMSVKAVVNKSFKGRDEKEKKLSSLGSIIPALYGGCPGGGVPPTAGARRGRRRCRHRRPRAGAKSLASHRLQRTGQLHSSSQMNRCLSLPAVSSEKQRRPLRGRGGESHTLWVMCNNSFDNCRGKRLPVFYPEKATRASRWLWSQTEKLERKRQSGSAPYEQCCLEKASIVNATLEQWHIRSQLPIEWAEKGLWLEIVLAGEHTCRERSIEPFGGPSSCQSCKSGHLVGRRIEAVESFNAKPLSNRRHVPSLQRQNEKCPSELTKYQGGTSSKLPSPLLHFYLGEQ